LDIGVLGYIGIVWPKEHSPEVSHIPPVTPCIWSMIRALIERHPQMHTCTLKLVYTYH